MQGSSPGSVTMKIVPNRESRTEKKRDQISSWDVVVLSFKLFYEQLQFWIRPNVLMVLLSIPILTAPGANAALYQSVAAGLRDPARTRTKTTQEMKTGFLAHFWRALGITLISLLVLLIILTSLWFWITTDSWALRSVSIISLYGLVMWWLSSVYLYPILVEQPDSKSYQVVKEAVLLAFRKPFESLLFATVSTLLLILGLVLLGPVLLIIPALRSILHLHGYWYLTEQVIPGFIDPVEYAKKYYP